MDGRTAAEIKRILERTYPDAKCELEFKTPFQLLIASILSAQCTDKKVNQVTPNLFARFRTPRDFAAADPLELEALIRPTGFYKQKARALIGCSKDLMELFGGHLPRTVEGMTKLRGVGRKTASLVVGCGFGLPAVPVDTHVKRVAYRIGLTDSRNVNEIEKDIMMLVPKVDWTRFTILLVIHGRRCCVAKRPNCSSCSIVNLCMNRL